MSGGNGGHESTAGTQKTKPPHVKSQTELLPKVAALRSAGASFREIGRQLEIDHSWARVLLLRALDQVQAESVELMRTQEGQRLDRLQVAAWQPALNGDTDAIRTVLKIMERRARLFGLDAPAVVEATITYTGDEIDQEVERLAHILDAADD